jgi:hypothetical protein
MKRYFLYAIILGFIGNSLLDNASHSIGASSTQTQLAALGE